MPPSGPSEDDIIVGVDPGTTQSAWVKYDCRIKKPVGFGLTENYELLTQIRTRVFVHTLKPALAIESVASYGMAVGATVFETCVWIGRFLEAFMGACTKEETPVYRRIYRKDEKIHLCGTMKAKDGNIRQSIMDRYGSTRQAAVGTKKNPGPLYGVSNDVWSALAVAITAAETADEWRTK
jgi:hypothetical protein